MRFGRTGAAVLILASLIVAVAAGAIVVREHRAEDPADASRRLATARSLAAASADALDTAPERALLLALEACRRACSAPPADAYETRDSLLTALQRAARLTHVARGTGAPRALAVSPDGSRVAMTTYDEETGGSLAVWDPAGGTYQRRRLGQEAHSGLVFSPNGRRITTAGWYGNVRTFDTIQLSPVGSPLQVSAIATTDQGSFNDDVGAVNLTADGRLAAVVGTHGVFNVWDVGKRQSLQGFPQSRFSNGTVDPSGTVLAAYSGDVAITSSVTFWDIVRGRVVGTTPFTARALTFSSDGGTAAIAIDGGIRLWDVRRGRDLRPPLKVRRQVISMAFDQAAARLAAESLDGVHVWDLRAARPVRRDYHASGPMSFSPDGRLLLVRSGKGVALVDVVRRTPLPGPIPLGEEVSAAFLPDSEALVSASRNGTLRLWSLSRQHPLIRRTIRHPGDPYRVIALAWSSDGKLLASGGFDGTARIGEADGVELAPLVLEAENPVASLDFNPAGSKLAVLASTHPVGIWDVGDNRIEGRIPPNGVSHVEGATEVVDEQLAAVAFAADGRLAVAEEGGRLRFWDVGTGRVGADAVQLLSTVDTFALSNRSDAIAMADHSGEIVLGRLSNGAVRDRITVETGWDSDLFVTTLYSIEFSADDSVLMASSADDTARFWDVQRGLPLGEPIPTDGAAALSARDGTLATAVGGGTIAIWDSLLLSTDWRAWERRVCSVVGRGLSAADWRRFLPDEEYRPLCGTGTG